MGQVHGVAGVSGEWGDSRLDKAFAEGAVQIVDTAAGHTRTGMGSHSEYYATEKKAILRGSNAKLVDSGGNASEGLELTYYRSRRWRWCCCSSKRLI